jgi:hypothetical protein
MTRLGARAGLRTKNWGQGTKDGAHRWLHPLRCDLVTTGHCPHLEGRLSRTLVPYGKFQSLVTKVSSVLSFLEPKVIAK